MKIKYLFSVIVFLSFFLIFFIKTSNAQICNSNSNIVKCRSYTPKKGADNLWFCKQLSNNDDMVYCTTQSEGGTIKCGYWKTCNPGSCYDGGGKKKPSQVVIVNCTNALAICTFVTCASTAPANTPTPTPTPTPATVCKPLGNPCSGGGGNCCSNACANGVCCKANGAPCGGAGGGCCSSYCNGTSCANAPTATPTPTPASCPNYNGQACAGNPPGGQCQTSPTCSTLPIGGACTVGGLPGTYAFNLCPGGGETRCCVPNPTPTPTPTRTPTSTPTRTPTPRPPTPTPAPALPWFKLRDASLVGNTSINDPIPVSPLTLYDSSDPGNRYLIDNSAGSDSGVATGQNISIGGAIVSAKNWKATGTSYVPQYTVQNFLDYARSRKSDMVVEITNINNAQANKINILTDSPTLTDGQLSSKRPLVLIVQGNVTLSGATINSSNQQQIIMSTGKIDFNTSVREANGLYIADSLDFGTTANQGIKIIGNIIAQSSFSNARQWSNAKRPGLFIVFDPSHYIGMIDMLSTITYDWRQIQ